MVASASRSSIPPATASARLRPYAVFWRLNPMVLNAASSSSSTRAAVTAGPHAASRRAQIAAADFVDSCCATMMRRSVANPGSRCLRRRITDPLQRPRDIRIDLRQPIDALDDNVVGKRMLHLSSVPAWCDQAIAGDCRVWRGSSAVVKTPLDLPLRAKPRLSQSEPTRCCQPAPFSSDPKLVLPDCAGFGTRNRSRAVRLAHQADGADTR